MTTGYPIKIRSVETVLAKFLLLDIESYGQDFERLNLNIKNPPSFQSTYLHRFLKYVMINVRIIVNFIKFYIHNQNNIYNNIRSHMHIFSCST